MRIDAVVRNFEIISEVAKNINEYLKKNPLQLTGKQWPGSVIP
jgi:uncharacterized protein with HEPN domain